MFEEMSNEMEVNTGQCKNLTAVSFYLSIHLLYLSECHVFVKHFGKHLLLFFETFWNLTIQVL